MGSKRPSSAGASVRALNRENGFGSYQAPYRPRLPVNASVLHCIATYVFCGLLLLFSVTGDLIITPYLLRLPLQPGEGKSAAEHTIMAAQRLHHGALEVLRAPEEELAHIPWTATNPLGLLVFSYGIASLLLPLGVAASWAHSAARLPRGPVLRKRLRHGNSALGRGLARLADHFDDSTFVGSARFLRLSTVRVLLGMSMILWILAQHLWALSLRDLSLPAANVLLYTFLFIVGLSQTTPLDYGRSFFKIFCAALSWLGICIFYFPGRRPSDTAAAAPPAELYTNSDDVFFSRGFACALLGAVCFAGYLMAFRRLNAPGPMSRVMGWQGVGALAGGAVLLLAAHIGGIEKLHLPRVGSDWKTLALHVLVRGLQLFALNEALRWGDAFCVATCVPVIPAVSYLLEGAITGEESGFVVTQSKLFAVLFTTIACGLLCSWYFLKISAVRSRMRFGPLPLDDEDEEDDENELEPSAVFGGAEGEEEPLLIIHQRDQQQHYKMT